MTEQYVIEERKRIVDKFIQGLISEEEFEKRMKELREE